MNHAYMFILSMAIVAMIARHMQRKCRITRAIINYLKQKDEANGCN